MNVIPDAWLADLIGPAAGASIVLLVDSVTLRLLTHMCTQTAIAEKGIVSTVLIDAADTLVGFSGNPCVTYTSLALESLDMLHRLLKTGRERKPFKELHIVFTELAPQRTVEELAKHDVAGLVQTVRVMFGSHATPGERLAVLPQRHRNPYTEGAVLQQAEDLLNLLLAMGVAPFIVRHSSVSSAAGTLAGHLHKLVLLRQNLFRYTAKGLINSDTESVDRDGSPTGAKRRYPPRTRPLEVIVLDRRADLQSVIKQNWMLLPLLSDFGLLDNATLEFVDDTSMKHQYSRISCSLFNQTYAADFFVLTMSIIPELRKHVQSSDLSQGEKNAVITVCSAATTLSEHIGKTGFTRIAQVENAIHSDNSKEAVMLLEKIFAPQGLRKDRGKDSILTHVVGCDTGVDRKLVFIRLLGDVFFSLVVMITLQYNTFGIPNAIKKMQEIATRFYHAAEQAVLEISQAAAKDGKSETGSRLLRHLQELSEASAAYLSSYGKQLANRFFYQWDNVETSARTTLANRVTTAASPGQISRVDANAELTAYLNKHVTALQSADPAVVPQIGANYSYKPRVLSVAEAAVSSLLLESDFPAAPGTDRGLLADVLREAEEHQVLIYVIGGVSQGEHAALETYDYYEQFNQGPRSPGLFRRKAQDAPGVACGLYSRMVTLASDRIVSRLSLVHDIVEDIRSGGSGSGAFSL